VAARIAQEPINTQRPLADFRPRTLTAGPDSSLPQLFGDDLPPQAPAVAESVPPPPPPGTAFAAAIIAGTLPPKPMTPKELQIRLGSAWQPPDSELHLTNRTA
jgi:hypothetical protein